MENIPGEPPVPSAFEQAVDEARAAARDQLAAAWQLQVERIEEELHAGWRDRLGRVFDERFAEIAARLPEQFDHAVAARAAEISESQARAGRRVAAEQLGLAVRRLSQAQASGDWAAALLDAAALHAPRCALFSVALRSVIAEGWRGLDAAAEWSGREIPLAQAPAFTTAIETRDLVIAARTAAEISPELAALTGGSAEDRAHLFPILSRGRCAAILYAEPSSGDDAALPTLDLLVSVAGLAAGARSAGAAAAGLVTLGPAAGGPAEWNALPPQEQELHLRAQRFARVQVSEMRLYHAAEVRFGRAQRNLYETLRAQFDPARETYSRQFLAGCTSMVDYLHQEVVRTLANGDAAVLGPAYPGPLV